MRLFFVSVFLLGAVEIAHSDESTPQEQRYNAIRADAAVMLSIRAAQFCYLSEARKRTKDEIATGARGFLDSRSFCVSQVGQQVIGAFGLTISSDDHPVTAVIFR